MRISEKYEWDEQRHGRERLKMHGNSIILAFVIPRKMGTESRS